MNEEELRRALEEIEQENKALKYRCTEKETYIVGRLEYDYVGKLIKSNRQRAIKMTEEQAKAIEWFIEETDIDCYIQKASEVKEEVG